MYAEEACNANVIKCSVLTRLIYALKNMTFVHRVSNVTHTAAFRTSHLKTHTHHFQVLVVTAPLMLFAIAVMRHALTKGVTLVRRRSMSRRLSNSRRITTTTVGIALGVTNLRQDRALGSILEMEGGDGASGSEGGSEGGNRGKRTWSLLKRAFMDNHIVFSTICGKEISRNTRLHKATILLTRMYGNFIACTVLFYIYYCRMFGNATHNFDELILKWWFWTDKVLLALAASVSVGRWRERENTRQWFWFILQVLETYFALHLFISALDAPLRFIVLPFTLLKKDTFYYSVFRLPFPSFLLPQGVYDVFPIDAIISN